MKTKLILLSALLLIGCGKKEYKNKFKFNQGDEVYIKINNKPCVIQHKLNIDSLPSYNILYLNEFNEYETISIYEFNLTDENKNNL
jgi:hypothetical protein